MNTAKKSYVAPAKRKQEIKEKGLSQDELNDEKLFPTLCAANSASWQGKTFKSTIESLIASEKLTQQEKIAREEARKLEEGWARVSLNLKRGDITRFNEMIETNKVIATMAEDPWYYKPTSNTVTPAYEKDADSVYSSDEEDLDDEELKDDQSE